MSEILGIDIGGVIIDRVNNDDKDTSFFSDNYLATTPVEGAFVAISSLVEKRFGPNVHLISKAKEPTQRRTMEWLTHREFFYNTGVKAENVHFCLTREEKAPICARLGITHFVDDRLDVLHHLRNGVENRYLFGEEPSETGLDLTILHGVTRVRNWAELLKLLIEADFN